MEWEKKVAGLEVLSVRIFIFKQFNQVEPQLNWSDQG